MHELYDVPSHKICEHVATHVVPICITSHYLLSLTLNDYKRCGCFQLETLVKNYLKAIFIIRRSCWKLKLSIFSIIVLISQRSARKLVIFSRQLFWWFLQAVIQIWLYGMFRCQAIFSSKPARKMPEHVTFQELLIGASITLMMETPKSINISNSA